MSYNHSRESGYQPRQRAQQRAPPLKNSEEGLAAQQRALVERESVERALAEQARAQKRAQRQAREQAYAPVAASASRAPVPASRASVSASASRASASAQATRAPESAPASKAPASKAPASAQLPVTTQKEKKPFYRKKPFIIFLVIILCVGIVLGLGLGLGLKSNTDTPDASEPTYTSTSRSSTSTAPTPAPITTAPTPEPTTTSVSLTQGPTSTTNIPTSTPTLSYIPTYDEHMSKVILYGLNNKLITIYSLYNKYDRIYDDINKKIKNLETELTLYSEDTNQKFIKKIKIKNCKINLKRTYIENGYRHDVSENFYHYMQDKYDQNDYFETTFDFPNYYSFGIIYIMSEIILYDNGGAIVNDIINNKDITEVIEISEIPFNGFKIRNCTITVYFDKKVTENGMTETIKGDGKVFFHTSKDDDRDEYDDSKCYSRKSFADASYNRIKIVPIKE